MVRSLIACGLAMMAAAAQMPPGQTMRLERIAADRMAAAGIPGMSVAVSLGDADAWVASFGFADVENALPVRPESVFRFASLSKPLTSLTAMSLAEQGRLDLDAPVQRYLPSFPEKQWPVTTRMLLANQGGIRHYEGDEFASTRHYGGVAEALQIFSGEPLRYEPGTRYLYSTYGFNLAGAVVEAAAGVPYWQAVAQRVLQPSGAPSLRPDHVYQLIPHRVRGYLRAEDGALRNCALADTSNKLPGGGWVGTAESLIRVGAALLDGRLLKPESVRAMWTPVPLKDGKSTGYGLGWGANRMNGVSFHEHSGGQQGASTHWIIVPGKQIQVVVLANLEGAPAREIAQALLEELLRTKE
jgi:CubicO group peptidase (beta-lactamase class C family)